MDGIHDLGGRAGFGAVEVEPDEPVFHHDWERRAWGVTMATFVLGVSNGGQFRHAIERMEPVHYLQSPYYEHWLTGTATRLVEAGRCTLDELEQRAGGRIPLARPVHPSAAADAARVPAPAPAPFAVGDHVRVRRMAVRGHTRCPAYVRGARGLVVRVDAPFSLPDVEAHLDERRREPVCCVRFDASELWGGGAEAGATVHVDLWQSYLEAA